MNRRSFRRQAIILSVTLVVASCSTADESSSGTNAPATSAVASTTSTLAIPVVKADPAVVPAALSPSGYSEIVIDGGPNVIVATSDAIWVELHRGDQVASINPQTNAVRPLPAIDVHCSIAANDQAVWGTHPRPGLVTRVDPVSGEASATLAYPDACGVAVGDDDVWVSSPGNSVLAELDPTTAEVLREIPAPGGFPFVLVSNGEFLWAAGESAGGWLAIIDKTSGTVVHKHMAPTVPFFDSIGFGFGSAWAVGHLDPFLYRLDPETGEPQAKIEIGLSPSGVVVTPDAVWVSQHTGTVSRVNPSTGEVTGAWTMPYTWLVAGPYAFDVLWMSSLEENALIRVDISRLTS